MSLIKHNNRIAVFRGGPSEEYQLSMQSGQDLISYLEATSHTVIDIIVAKNGEWIQDGIVRQPNQILDSIDSALLATYGAYGEDGTIQRILGRHGTPYLGSGALSSAIGFNKMTTKETLKGQGIKMPKHMRVSRESLNNISRIVHTIASLFGPEYTIKPTTSGSSFGVVHASGEKDLAVSLSGSLEAYPEVLVEEKIHGRDVTCAYLDDFRDRSDYTFPALELHNPDVTHRFDGLVAEKIYPAQITTAAKKLIEEITKTVHNTLHCTQISRSDFVVTNNGEVYFLEINTLPSLAKESPFLFASETVGASKDEVIEKIIQTVTNKQ